MITKIERFKKHQNNQTDYSENIAEAKYLIPDLSLAVNDKL